MTLLLAIDPGLTGAVAAFRDGVLVSIHDVPTVEFEGSRIVDTWRLERDLKPAASDCYFDACVVERAQPMPGDGKGRLFAYGITYGALLQFALSSCGSVITVPPARWKRDLGLLKGSKRDSLEMAKEAFPEQRGLFTLQKHHNRAEAALIGKWAIDTRSV